MKPYELEHLAKRLFGRDWRKVLRERLGCDQSTIWRYVHGKRKIPAWLERDLLLVIKERKLSRVTRLLGAEKAPKVRIRNQRRK